MEQFFKSPHLPDSKVRALIVGECYAARLSPALESFGVRVIPCPINPYVDARLSYHSDLSVYHVGGKCFYLARHLRDSELAKELEHLGASVRFSKARQGGEYPLDASLCALPLGDAVYHNAKICDELIVQSTSRFENIKQGYAKCAVCPVSSDAAITADKGVARVLDITASFTLMILSPIRILCLTALTRVSSAGLPLKLRLTFSLLQVVLTCIPIRRKSRNFCPNAVFARNILRLGKPLTLARHFRFIKAPPADACLLFY